MAVYPFLQMKRFNPCMSCLHTIVYKGKNFVMNRLLLKLSILFGFQIVCMLICQPLLGVEKSNWRMGLGRMMYSLKYGYETLRTSGGATYDKTISKTSSATVHSTVLVTEYLPGPAPPLRWVAWHTCRRDPAGRA